MDDEFDQIWKEDEWFQAWYWEVGLRTNRYKKYTMIYGELGESTKQIRIRSIVWEGNG